MVEITLETWSAANQGLWLDMTQRETDHRILGHDMVYVRYVRLNFGFHGDHGL